jgi:hypothetical protein
VRKRRSSQVAKAVIATAKEGFDAVVDIGSTIAGSTGTTTASAVAVDDGVREVSRQAVGNPSTRLPVGEGCRRGGRNRKGQRQS